MPGGDLPRRVFYFEKQRAPYWAARRLAAELGFEPRQTESESVVLPLHNSALFSWALGTGKLILYTAFRQCQ